MDHECLLEGSQTKVLDALNRGLSHKEVSELFGLSLSTIKRYVKRRQGEDLEPRPSTGRKRRTLAPTQQKRAPWRQLEENDEATLERHCELWEERQGLPREQLREEPLGIPQERAFALHAPKLLQERQGEHLGVGELLYGLVGSPAWVEEGISVVDEAEQYGDRLFQGREGGSMLRMGHPRFLSSGSRMAPFYS